MLNNFDIHLTFMSHDDTKPIVVFCNSFFENKDMDALKEMFANENQNLMIEANNLLELMIEKSIPFLKDMLKEVLFNYIGRKKLQEIEDNG